jgi:thiopurine S-methyltransferase
VDPAFWLERWEHDQTGWHQATYNPSLQRHWPALELRAGGHAFVPLCGKSLDMHWLRGQGHPVYGVELSRRAIEAFFAEANLPCDHIAQFGGVSSWSHGAPAAPEYRLYGGDFFELSVQHLRGVVGTWDRGALVALPPTQRAQYADHLQRIVGEGSVVLLVALEYDQALAAGPPFSVSASEVQALYGERCRVQRLDAFASIDLPPRFREAGVTEVVETVYRLDKID